MDQFQQATSPPVRLRASYLDSLTEPQEWFLEELIQDGQSWVLPSIAYGITAGTTLVEFYVDDAVSGDASDLFGSLQKLANIKSVLAKSYDHQLLQILRNSNWQVSETGYLFRKFTPRKIPHDPRRVFRPASSADLSSVWQINDGFFECVEEVADLIHAEKLWVLELDNSIIGAGVANRIVPEMDAVDLGMLIAADRRGQGHGTYVIARLAELTIEAGLRPVCGCAEHNIASRTVLTKAGFESEHRLVHCEPS